MKVSVDNNENWGTCPKCGEPVLIDPDSGQAQPCANCASLASRGAGVMGIVLLLVGVVAIVGLVYFCIRMLW